jgi:hypothetical protein
MVIASGAAFVPLGVSLDVANPMLKVLWRVSTMLPFLAVLGVAQAMRAQRLSEGSFNPINAILDIDNFSNLFIAALCISL